MTIDNAVFICGCGHSGTSLLANMFASHPDVFIPLYETATFTKEEEVQEKLLVLENLFHSSGKEFLFEKTPSHILALDRIRAMIRSPKFILTVRDGRDVAASFIKRHGNAMIGADRWFKENTIVCEQAEMPDTLVVRYEDVVVHPERELRAICDFTGLAYTSAMLEYSKTPRLWFGATDFKKGSGKDGVDHIQLRNWQINQPIFDGRGQWQTLLSEDELKFFELDNVKKIMKNLGYA